MTGAFGGLAVIVDATFKLSPTAPASRTVVAELDDPATLDLAIDAATTSSLTPVSMELELPETRLLVRFESVETAVEQQAAELERLVHAVPSVRSVETLSGDDERARWSAYREHWDAAGTLIKLTTLPRALMPTVQRLADACRRAGLDVATRGRAGLGVVDVRLTGAVEAQAAVIDELRGWLPSGEGAAVVRRAAADLRRAVDPWGPLGSGRPIMAAVKQRFDPAARLNPGRGPV